MDPYKSSFGVVGIELKDNDRIELFDEYMQLTQAEAEIVMQEFIDEFPQDGKYGKNEIGECEDWEDGTFVAEIL